MTGTYMLSIAIFSVRIPEIFPSHTYGGGYVKDYSYEN